MKKTNEQRGQLTKYNSDHLNLNVKKQDSGGIQEEAPSLGKPVLVMRKITERTEGIEAGTAKVVGTASERIFSETTKLIEDEELYHTMAKAVNPYGDGRASEGIYKVLKTIF